jgi:uncharacterized membrane protein
MSDQQEHLDRIFSAVKEGGDLSNADARALLEVIDSLDFAFRVQNTVNTVMAQTIPEMAASLAGSVLSRAGRTETKIQRAVAKICDEHVNALMGMITALASNLIAAATEGQDQATEETTNEA